MSYQRRGNVFSQNIWRNWYKKKPRTFLIVLFSWNCIFSSSWSKCIGISNAYSIPVLLDFCKRLRAAPLWERKHMAKLFLPKPYCKGYIYHCSFLQVILSIGVSWIVCVILTTTDTVPNNSTHPNYQTRTDARLYVLDKAPWFYWPYPCK